MIEPFWNVPSSVGALCTIRSGGVSRGCYSSLNLGFHTGDNIADVCSNRSLVQRLTGLERIVYVNQIHGTDVLTVDETEIDGVPSADAIVTRIPNVAIAIMTADCLSVLFASESGSVVGNAHAGWRGLCAGVLENTISAMNVIPESIHAYLGPCIGPKSFEVGSEVAEAFLDRDLGCRGAFLQIDGTDKFLADLPLLAVRRLLSVGLRPQNIYGGYFDTLSMKDLFFSYRREKTTGRMASIVWIRR